MSIATDVMTERRFAQWEVAFAPWERIMESKVFTIGTDTTLKLSVQRDDNGQTCSVTLTPYPLKDSWNTVTTVCIKVTHFPRTKLSDQNVEIRFNGYFRRVIPDFVSGRLLVNIKFVNTTKKVVEGIIPVNPMPQASSPRFVAFARMLNEGTLTDITLNAVGGSMTAHRVVLATRSPVFMMMFTHDLKEKQQSAVDIFDMSHAACQAFIRYLYEDLPESEFLVHRSELLFAAEKYDVPELKKKCEDSMFDDIGTENVIERLQMAHLFELLKLKATCMRLLVEFKWMYEISEDFEDFMDTGDVDLIAEVLQACREQSANEKLIYRDDESLRYTGKPMSSLVKPPRFPFPRGIPPPPPPSWARSL